MRLLAWGFLRRQHRVNAAYALIRVTESALERAAAATVASTAIGWLDQADGYLDAAAAVSGPLGAWPGGNAQMQALRNKVIYDRALYVARARFGGGHRDRTAVARRA
jgi:hypothetical protein